MELLVYLVATVSVKRLTGVARIKMVQESILYDNILAHTTRRDLEEQNLWHQI
jgi:hypothetical protein